MNKENWHALAAIIIYTLVLVLIIRVARCDAPTDDKTGALNTAQPTIGSTLDIDLTKLTNNTMIFGNFAFLEPEPFSSWSLSLTYHIANPFYAQVMYTSSGTVGTVSGIYQRHFEPYDVLLNASYDTILSPLKDGEDDSTLADTLGRVSLGAQINADAYVWEADVYIPVTSPSKTTVGKTVIVTQPSYGFSGFIGAKFTAFDYHHMIYIAPEYFRSTGYCGTGRIGYWLWLNDNIFAELYYGAVPTNIGLPSENAFGVRIGFDGGIGTSRNFATPLLFRTSTFEYSIATE